MTNESDLLDRLVAGEKKLGEIRKRSRAEQSPPDPSNVSHFIGRLAALVREVPVWWDEVRARGTFIQRQCGPDSKYFSLRDTALESYRGNSRNISPFKVSLDRLRRRTAAVVLLRHIAEDRRDVECILREGVRRLSDDAKQAFGEWRDECCRIEREAQSLEVDGFWQLYWTGKHSDAIECDQSKLANAMLMDSYWADAAKSTQLAVGALVRWARKRSARSEPEHETAPEPGDGKPTIPSPPVPTASSPSSSVQLFDRAQKPIVNGQEVEVLTIAQYDVVRALLEAGDRGLTKDQLDRNSKHGEARKVLYRLREKSGRWKSAIKLAGSTGKHYRVP